MNPGLLRGFPGDTRPRYVHVAEVMYDVTLGSNGAFDTNDVWPVGIPQGCHRLGIHAMLRSTASVSQDVAYIFLNADTTEANYRRIYVGRYAGGAMGSTGNDPFLAQTTGATAPANEYASVSATIETPDSAKNKSILSEFGFRETASDTRVGQSFIAWVSAAAITRIQLRTDNHPTDLFAAGSSMRLIGYRNIPISELLA